MQDALHRLIDLLDQSMDDNDTDETFQEILILYAHGRGGTAV